MSQKSRVLTANQIEVVRWLTTPQKSRQPKIEAELAKTRRILEARKEEIAASTPKDKPQKKRR